VTLKYISYDAFTLLFFYLKNTLFGVAEYQFKRRKAIIIFHPS